MNEFEKKIKLYLEGLGYEVLRNGYPDFMIKRIGRYEGLACVEVKNKKDKLRPEQEKMIKAFKEAGLPTYILRPQDFENPQNSHALTPTGRKKRIGRCKKVISVNDYNKLYKEVLNLKNRLESRSEWWFNELLRKIDEELAEIFNVFDKIKEVEELIKTHGVIVEVDEPNNLILDKKEIK
tara:strand:+ start:420 stop:959 length:540 start_codon:yes stop_codon:yes gene_type:complete